MSIVSEDCLKELDRVLEKANKASSYQSSYEYAVKGLEMAIILLKQIDKTTTDFSVYIKNDKDIEI